MTNYIVAAQHDWNRSAFERRTPELPGNWHYISEPNQLTADLLARLDPRYVFFPHWSALVPEEIFGKWECVCFHMSDVPYGRGGSPLQNLIARRQISTQLTALRMERELDAGPVYLKRPLELSGSAQEIFERAAELVYDLIGEIVACEPLPTPQQGEPVVFKRRRPGESILPIGGSPTALFDHIRMLDAEGYPSAFLDFGEWRLEFSRATMTDGVVGAHVVFSRRKEVGA